MNINATFWVLVALFAVSLAFGILTWAARNVWKDIRTTRIFALIAAASAIAFVVIGVGYLPK